MTIRSSLVLLLIIVASCTPIDDAATISSTDTVLTVSAAADLTPAFTEIGELFEQSTGIGVTFNFGSTGQLAQQIQQGAPVDLFAAANTSFIEQLSEAGLIIPDSRAIYAVGRITLWTLADSPLILSTIDDLNRPEIERIAIANPEHAPYGVAAREALQTAAIWDLVQPKLVMGENIAQTLQFAASGNVDVAIVALSLSIQSEGKWILLPETLHNPLIQELAVLQSTMHETEARQFAAYVNSSAGREIMYKYGFILPGEEAFTAND